MDQSTHDVRRKQWLSIVTECQARPEGTTVREWLSENGIKEKACYYWLQKFRKVRSDDYGYLVLEDRLQREYR